MTREQEIEAMCRADDPEHETICKLYPGAAQKLRTQMERAWNALASHRAAEVAEARPIAWTRDQLGRFVREAWVRWAQTQPDPKASWLLPYDELAEPDKEADRQIGEAVARWTLIGDASSHAMAEMVAAAPDAREAEEPWAANVRLNAEVARLRKALVREEAAHTATMREAAHLREALEAHHDWHQASGVWLVPDPAGGAPIEIDNAAEYADSSLCEQTMRAPAARDGKGAG